MQLRKLIAHGPSSLTLALPHKWIKRQGLSKGDTVAVSEDEQGLRLQSRPTEQKKNISINISGHDAPGIMTVLTTVYRRGYDEVTIRYETSEEYQHVASAARALLGFAIMENRKGRCLIKSLPTQLEQDFPALFRRVFLMLLQELEDLAENSAAGSGTTGQIGTGSADLKAFYHRDADVNAIVNLAIRMINKGYIADRFEELHLFHALLVLEELGDDIVRFTIEASSEKDTKLKPAIMHCSKMLRMLYEKYFQKNGTIMDFYHQYYLYWPDAAKEPTPVLDALMKAKGPTFYLRSIIEKVIQLAEMLLLPKAEIEG